MVRHQLPQIVSGISAIGRYLLSYFHGLSRALFFAFYRMESPRGALRTALARKQRATPNEKPLLIHYHIFKNAGTSFEWALEQTLGRVLLRLDSASQAGFVSAREIARYVAAHPEITAIASHQAAPPPPQIRGRRVLTSILLRDPLARIRSIYVFERKQISNSPGAQKAKEFDFKGYVEWRLATTPRMFCNYQVHFCCRDGSPSKSPVTQTELARAITALDEIEIVGTVERYEEWLRLAESILADSFPSIVLAPVRRNPTRSAPPLSEAEVLSQLERELGSGLAHELIERNELDMSLHQVADALLTRRLAERGISIKLRDAYESARGPQGSD